MDFDAAFKKFMKTAQTIVDVDMYKYPGQIKTLTYTKGKRYIRVVAESGIVAKTTTIQSSAWAFIDMTNGNILKPATWKAPAKHARGNIFDGYYHLTPYGPPYMR